MDKQYIYIVQASLEPSKCKIGKTNDLERRLQEYNNMTGKSKENTYKYLFTCEVSDMTQVENDIKKTLSHLREAKNREIYFYNPDLFDRYVKFIKSHTLFVKEILTKQEDKEPIVEIVKKTTPSLEERGMSRINLLHQAKKTKNDEFYTRYEDVEAEISMYDKSIWKDKVVYCNCDDAVDDEKDERRTSAFALYFLRNFEELGLKKLICTHYSGGIDLFHQGTKGYVYVFTKDGFEEIKTFPEGYSGSFDDPLSLKILNKEADIVCTNPPFSRTKDYWKVVIESGKQFLIISNAINPIKTSYIPYFMEGKVWSGYHDVCWYFNQKKQLVRAPGYWYTNLPVTDRPNYKNLKIIPLDDIPEKYKYYDDAGTLVVSNSYIPSDYEKPFGVSVCPILNGLLEKGYKIVLDKTYCPYINGKAAFARTLVQKI